VVKRLEWFAKILFAVVMAALCWRPGRRAGAGARLQGPKKRVLLVRVDNRVGEALLTTPLVDLLAQAGHEVHVLTHPKVRRVLEGHPHVTKLWDYRPRREVLAALRAERFDVVINCGNWDLESVTSAVVARLAGGPSVVLGPANFPSGWLMDVPVSPLPGTRSEAAQRRHLASPLIDSTAPVRMSFRPTAAFEVVAAPYAVVNPGGRLGYRRVVPERFAEAAAALLAAGVTPVVTWGPGEEALVDAVCAACPGAVRAPATSLDQLAALMRGAKVTVCNNTGPMHLAVAVGCPTLALFLHMEVERWGHPYAPHQMLDLTGVADPTAAVRHAISLSLRERGEGRGEGLLSPH
jgi:ADP-heptose:LPS heptosyltransferase